jgi:hypothetical protein
MTIKTVQQVLLEHSSYKASSLYAAILKAIKTGGLSGKAIPINRNDANSKFRLPKTGRQGAGRLRPAGREVTNFVLIDLAAFEAWFEASKASLRTTIAINRRQVVMPHLAQILAGKYTSEQLAELAAHVAKNRYGSGAKRDRRVKAKRGSTQKATKATVDGTKSTATKRALNTAPGAKKVMPAGSKTSQATVSKPAKAKTTKVTASLKPKPTKAARR